MSNESPPPAEPSRPRRPHRGLAAGLAAFLEESNILWGELVGGVLVVGCSAALILSLWPTFGDNPLFKFTAFTGATAGVFGAGLYTLNRWRLAVTSRGLLLVALLLGPLNVLALALPGPRAWPALELGGQLATLAVLAVLARRAARAFAPDLAGLIAAALALISAWQVAAGWLPAPALGDWLPALTTGPPATLAALAVLALTWVSPAGLASRGLLLLLGVGAFATGVSLGLVAFLAADGPVFLRALPVPLALAALAPLGLGAHVHAALAGEKRAGTWRLAGTAAALAGGVLLTVATGLAWPRPGPMLATCALAYLALTAVAFRSALPVAHGLALPALAGGALAGCSLAGSADGATAGFTLLGLAAALGLAGEGLARRGRSADAAAHTWNGLTLLAPALGLVSLAGPESPARPAVAFALAAALVAGLDAWGSVRRRSAAGVVLAVTLLAGSALWALQIVRPFPDPLGGTLLALSGAACVAGALLLRRRDEGAGGWPAGGLLRAAALLGLAGAAVLGVTAGFGLATDGRPPWHPASAATLLLLAALYGGRGWALDSPPQLRLALGLLLAGLGVAGSAREAHLALAPGALAAPALTAASLALAGLALVIPRLAAPGRELALAGTAVGLALVGLAPALPHHAATLALAGAACGVLAWAPGWRGAGLFAACQVLLAAALAGFVLHLHGWEPSYFPGPAELSACVLAVAGLQVGWQAVRLGPPAVARLIPPGAVTADRPALGVLLAALAAEALAAAWPGVLTELTPAGDGVALPVWWADLPSLTAPARWALWGLLGLGLGLVRPAGAGVVTGAAALVLLVPVLLPGGATSLRWGEAAAFVLASLPLWFRDPLARWLRRPAPPEGLVALARTLLVAGACAVVLGLTVAAAGLRLVGLPPRGPGADTWFAHIGPFYSAIVPAALLCAGLLAHALRERLPGYAFAVGLAANLLATLVLRSQLARAEAESWWTPLLLANALASAGTALLWLAGRRRLYGAAGSGTLLLVQLSVGPALLLGVLASAFAVLARDPGAGPAGLLPVGGALGWSALAAVAAGLAWGAAALRPGWLPHALLGSALGAGLLTAHTLAGRDGRPGFAWAALEAAVALQAAGVIAVGWRRGQGPALPAWAGALTLALVALTLRRVADPAAAPAGVAGPLAVAAALAGLQAGWQRREAWALLACLLTAGAWLAVRADPGEVPSPTMQILLGQEGLTAGGLALLAWAVVRRGAERSGAARADTTTDPLLVGAVALAGAGAVALAALAGGLVVVTAGQPSPLLPALGGPAGWAALAVALAALAAVGGRALRPHLTALISGAGLAAVALGAAGLADAADPWLPYHVVMAGPLALAAGLLAAGVGGALPRGAVTAAVALLLGLGAGAALRGVGPAGTLPAWWGGALAGVAVGLAALAGWRRGEGAALAAALTAEGLAGLLLWHAHDYAPPAAWWVELAQGLTAAAAGCALLWLLAAWLGRGARPTPGSAPLLTLQVGLPLLGAAVLLAGPLAGMLASPGALPAEVARAGTLAGALALAAALVPAALYAGRSLATLRGPLLALLGLAVGAEAACAAARFDAGDWLAYHVLLGSACAVAGLTLAASARRLSPPLVGALAALVVALALRAAGGSPAEPWTTAGPVALAAGLLAAVAGLRRAPGWALAAGLLACGAASLLVEPVHRGAPLSAWWVQLLQANVAVAAVAALLWQSLRPREEPAPAALGVQVALPAGGALALLAAPLGLLVATPRPVAAEVIQAGQAGGWAAVGLAALAVGWYAWRAVAAVGVVLLAGSALALGVLAACGAAAWDTGDWLAYRVLLGAWALAGVVVLARGRAAFREAGRARRPAGWREPDGLGPCNAALGAVLALTVGLALRAAAGDPAAPWSAVAALALVGLQAAVAGVWQRSEPWGLAAVLTADLAVSLVVWHVGGTGDEPLWVQLLQANVVSGSLASLLWVVANRRAYLDRPPGVRAAPLLSLQTVLGLAGNMVLLGQPAVVGLLLSPGDLPPEVARSGDLSGWLTLGLAAGVALVQLRLTRMHGGAQVVGGLGLGFGVLLACSAAAWDTGDWLAYHVLMTAWLAQAALTLALGRWGGRAGEPLLSEGLVREGVAAAGVPVLLLAVRAAPFDPSGAWWAAGAAAGVGALVVLVGVAQRRAGWLFAGGLVGNLAVSLVVARLHLPAPLTAWWPALVRANAAASAVAALAWLAAGSRAASGAGVLAAQVLLSLAGAVAAPANAAVLLARAPGAVDANVAVAGEWPGWAALALAGGAAWWAAGAAGAWLRRLLAAGLGLAAGAALAGSLAPFDRGDWLAFHALLAAWAALTLGLAVGPALASLAGAVLAGSLTLALVARGAGADPAGPWWLAGALVLLALAQARQAARYRAEGWALGAGLLLDVAAALVVWHAHAGLPLSAWWIPLVQVLVGTGSAGALLWLAGRRGVAPAGDGPGPLLRLRVGLGLAGNLALLAGPTAWLIAAPHDLHPAVAQGGGPAAWATLAAALLPAAWLAWRWMAGAGVHLAGGLFLAGAALLGCSVATATGSGWAGLHALLAGLLLAQAGCLGAGRGAPAGTVWAAGLGALALGLGARLWPADPGGAPWVVAAVALQAGLAALRACRDVVGGWTLLAGALACGAASLTVAAVHRPAPVEGWALRLALVNLVMSAAAALPWLLLRRPGTWAEAGLALAALAGVVALLAPPAALLALDPGPAPALDPEYAGPWAGAALVAALLAAGALWRRAGWPVPEVIIVGLTLLLTAAAGVAAEVHLGHAAGHRVLLPGLLLGAAALAGWRPLTAGAGAGLGLLVGLALALAVRGVADDPAAPPWALAGVALAGGLLAVPGARGRGEGWLLAAALTAPLAAGLGVWHLHAGAPWPEWWVTLVQALAGASALASLAWIGLAPRASGWPAVVLRGVQLSLAPLGCAAVLLPALARLVAEPGVAHPDAARVGSAGGWMALALALAALRPARRALGRAGLHGLAVLGLLAGGMLACTAVPLTADPWVPGRVLLVAWAVVGALALAAGPRFGDRSAGAGWAFAVALLLAGLALRWLPDDPHGPGWGVAGLLLGALLAGAAGLAGRAPGAELASGLMLAGAGLAAAPALAVTDARGLAWLGALSLAGSALAWAAVRAVWTGSGVGAAFHHLAGAVALAAVAGLSALGAGEAVAGVAAGPDWRLAWPALAGCVALAWRGLAESPGPAPAGGLYVAGLAGLALGLAGAMAEWRPAVLPALGAFASAAGWLARGGRRGEGWLVPAQVTLAAALVVASAGLSVAGDALAGRAAGPAALLLALPALVTLTGVVPESGRGAVRGLALGLAALVGAEALALAVDPAEPDPWAQGLALLQAGAGVYALVVGVILPRRPRAGAWAAPGRAAGWSALAVAGLLLACVVAVQGVAAAEGRPPVLLPAAAFAVGGGLVLLAVAALAFALRPDLDPLGPAAGGRTLYVYAAEGLLAALLVHARLAAPGWFTGPLAEYWTFAVLGVAFAGAGLSEVLDRLGRPVLAAPLRRTGVLLPLVPLVGFWVRPAGDHAALWFAAGAFYAALALARRTLALLLLAALAANAGLWVVLHDNQLAFVRYPQLWLVPLALTVLAAAQINRDRLSRGQLAAVRYLALAVVYAASSAETLMAGLGHDVARPLALVGLAVLGVFAGMVLRVRAFLFLGAGFVGLGVLALVWHAASGQSWVWYAAGIALGVALIVLFAVFENRRPQVLALLEWLRAWE